MTPTLDSASRRVRLDPRDPAFTDDPYPAYAAIRAVLPAFFWEDYGFWCFTRHDDVSALLREKRFGRQILHLMTREELGWPAPKAHLAPFDALERHSILEMEPPEHTRLRNLVNRAFVSRQVDKLAPRIAALAHERLDVIQRDGASELIEAFASPIPVAIITDLLGVPRAMGPQLLTWSRRMVAMYQFGVTRDVELAAAAAAQKFADFMRGYAKTRRTDLREDLISQLLVAESEEGKLSEEELVTTCILLLNAGHEATVHAIGNAVRTILDRALDPRTLFADAKTTAATVEELLRLDPPLHLFTRYALEDVEACGVPLRRGDRIGLLLGAANRDPERFPDPDAFEPGRDPQPARRVRGRRPLLRRCAAGAARDDSGPADPVRAPRGFAAGRASALPRRVSFPRPRGAEGRVGLKRVDFPSPVPPDQVRGFGDTLSRIGRRKTPVCRRAMGPFSRRREKVARSAG